MLVLEDHLSTSENVDIGVPQNSVLWSYCYFMFGLLFLMYIHINSLQNNTGLNVLIFAYDTLLHTIFDKTSYKKYSAYLNA